MNIFRDIFLTKEEKEYLKLYQKNIISFLLKKKYVLKIYRDNISDNELKEKICVFLMSKTKKTGMICLENIV